MTVHKLSAGDGYTYLTRQVASADTRRARGQSLAEYYVARGNPPGVWMGHGAAQLEIAGSVVTESQMKALFGRGLHPDGEQKLGSAYPTYSDLAPYTERLAARLAEWEEANGRPPSETVRNHLASVEARRGRRAVSGYDLVFTPVKSVSLLWALGGPEVREQVEAAHQAAMANALAWIEEHAAYTRVGRGGTAQIDTTGLICAAFDHRESRAGDPDLHTHVAVANKVCGVDGKWRSLDARILYALGVAASERYNTRIEDELARRLDVRFVDSRTRADKRQVREIEGVPPELIQHFSRRRAAIESRYADLRRAYREEHGREPDNATQLQLAQQATLETRESKGRARTLAEQVEDWEVEARGLLGSRRFGRFVSACRGQADAVRRPSPAETAALATEVVRRVSSERSTWTIWNVQAEAERLLRSTRLGTPTQREALTAAVVEQATGPDLSIRIRPPELIAEPSELVRSSDGESVFVVHGGDRYTSGRVLLAEDALVAAARDESRTCVDEIVLEAALAVHESSSGLHLDPGQRSLVQAFAGNPNRIVVGIGPAGAGKTTAMKAFADVWTANGGRVVPLATSARAAEVLALELGMRAENLHKFLYEQDRSTATSHLDSWFDVREGDVILLDEAGMAGTMQLSSLLGLAEERGACIRLLGDPAQLASVDAGGALRLIEHEAGAAYLTDLHRFADPAEGTATLRLRNGDQSALDFYKGRDRIRSGGRDAMLEAAYDGWAQDVRAGKVSVLVAATSEDVRALNARARTERILAGQVAFGGTEISDGNLAGVGDWVVTRRNHRTLTGARGRWVHNGDTWRVERVNADGSLTVQPLAGQGRLRLPSVYVADAVELAYASTAHRAQGSTTDTAHTLVTSEMTRESLYVASTRARECTTWYTAVEAAISVDCHTEPPTPSTATEVINGVLRRSGAELSATDTIRSVIDDATTLPSLISQYDHARGVAAANCLEYAAAKMPAGDRAAILADRSAPRLARALASAPAAVDRAKLLRDAWESDSGSDLPTRVREQLGANASEVRPPLPWLDPPSVGHPAWDEYLGGRAALIRQRANDLGSPAAIYREAFRITTYDDLGPVPAQGTRQAEAYDAALASLQKTTSPTHDALASPVPARRPGPGRTHPQLTR